VYFLTWVCVLRPRRPGVSLHTHPACLRALQRGVQAPGGVQAQHAPQSPGPAVRLALLPGLGRGAAAGLELVRPRGRADLLLAGLGGALLEQLQLPHPLHAAVLRGARHHHRLLLRQSAPLHEEGSISVIVIVAAPPPAGAHALYCDSHRIHY